MRRTKLGHYLWWNVSDDEQRISGRRKERASDDTDVLERVNKFDYIRFGKGVH